MNYTSTIICPHLVYTNPNTIVADDGNDDPQETICDFCGYYELNPCYTEAQAIRDCDYDPNDNEAQISDELYMVAFEQAQIVAQF